MEFIVLCGQIVGGGTSPFRTEYAFDGKLFAERALAIKHGLKIRGSDDFNIGVVKGRNLVSLDWMEDPIDTDTDTLSKIASGIDL